MKRFVGLDIHKKLVEACVIDAEGQVLLRERCNCTREGLQAFARQYLTRQDAVALEATFHTWSVVAVLKPGTVVNVIGGPQSADGLRWWQISLTDGSASGWAVDQTPDQTGKVVTTLVPQP